MRNSRQFHSHPLRKVLPLFALAGFLAPGDISFGQDFGDSVAEEPNSIETRTIEASTSQGSSKRILSYEGEWGKLQARDLILEPPVPHVSPNSELLNWKEGTVWEFQHDATEVIRILQLSGLDLATINTLTSPPYVTHGIGITEIRPPESVILNLSPETRRNLYPYIGAPGEISYFRSPLRFLSGGFPRMAETPSGLSQNIKDLITRLSFTKEGGALYISDLRYVFSQAANDAERLRIMRTISREASLHSWLDLSETTDKSSLIPYWSANGKNPGAITILNAALENTGINRLELIHLLPPVPRKLLHTYAEPEQGVGNYLPDCHSTSFSFFSNSLPPRLFDSVGEVADERYVRATKPWQFGDVILIKGENGEWVHACNYIAGEIVFTKNGQSLSRPWVLQTFNEVFASYMIDDRMQAFFFRLKPEYRE